MRGMRFLYDHGFIVTCIFHSSSVSKEFNSSFPWCCGIGGPWLTFPYKVVSKYHLSVEISSCLWCPPLPCQDTMCGKKEDRWDRLQLVIGTLGQQLWRIPRISQKLQVLPFRTLLIFTRREFTSLSLEITQTMRMLGWTGGLHPCPFKFSGHVLGALPGVG